jgi:hypothetical protein
LILKPNILDLRVELLLVAQVFENLVLELAAQLEGGLQFLSLGDENGINGPSPRPRSPEFVL